jgi:hypothetical protein
MELVAEDTAQRARCSLRGNLERVPRQGQQHFSLKLDVFWQVSITVCVVDQIFDG